MTVAEAMQAIESDRFAALTNLASNVKTFLRIAADQPETQALRGILANSPAAAPQVSRRALELSTTATDSEREHPADAALATYLWLLGNHPPQFDAVAAAILSEADRFFWARKFAERCPAPTGSANRDGAPAKGAANGTPATDARTARRES
jgi:hypothetical protein